MLTPVETARSGLLVTLSLALALAGCGGSSGNGVASKSATEILAASEVAAASATSVHVLSRASQGPLVMTSDLELANGGGRAEVSLLGLSFEALRVGDMLYAKGNPAFYKNLGGAAAKVPAGTWLKGPVNGAELAPLAAFVDLRGELRRLVGGGVPVSKGAGTAVNGQPAIELKQTGKLFTGDLLIATTGKPYPVQLIKHGRETGQTTFSDWNQPVSVTPPANAVAIGAPHSVGDSQ